MHQVQAMYGGLDVTTGNHAHQKLFPFSIACPTHSSCYPFLYSACKRPLSSYATGMSLNCTSQDYCPPTSTSLNCQPSWNHSSSMTLNCRLTQTTHDMPSGHVRHLSHLRHLGHLGHWTYSSPYVILEHLRQLGHPGHLGHLSHLGNISDLNTLDPYPLNPLPTETPLLPPCLNRHYTSQALALSWSRTYTNQTHGQSSDPLDFPLDTLDVHGSFLEIPR
jgi:hypothetical protein